MPVLVEVFYEKFYANFLILKLIRQLPVNRASIKCIF
jgi:hypothetical protein